MSISDKHATGGAPVQQVSSAECPVSSWNEWDPLEEVIVGRLEGATIPPRHVAVHFNVPGFTARLHRLVAGLRYPRWMVQRAQAELDALIQLLEAEHITVRRPDLVNHRARFMTPHWSSHGFCNACPRDCFAVLGDEILETPTCWRTRHFEALAYRSLFKEYFRAGARWSAAPKPALPDALFDYGYHIPGPGEPMRYLITEFEPVFDAADFVRCGRHLFIIRSNVTNQAGIAWLRRHLAPRGLQVHEIPVLCRQPMHIDSSFMPLAPGKVLVNPEYVDIERLPRILKRWDILIAPHPDPVDDLNTKFSMCSPWTSINVLMLDERRVLVDSSQPTLQRALRGWGFDPIPIPFLAYGPFGGAFHCATLDVRRRGDLQDYFA
jgi:glycine amidinotransferase